MRYSITQELQYIHDINKEIFFTSLKVQRKETENGKH